MKCIQRGVFLALCFASGAHVLCAEVPRSNRLWSPVEFGSTNWIQATKTAAFSPRGYHASIVHAGQLWVLGGYNGVNFNDVWRSIDGTNWSTATIAAGWSARHGHSAVSFAGKMWILGGDDGTLRNDVWSSADGINWTLALGNAPWSPRDQAAALVFDDKLWIFGGGSTAPTNDVWWTADGTNWTCATAGAEWMGRYGHSVVQYQSNQLWLVGGCNEGTLGDVWLSEDGVSWAEKITDPRPAGWIGRANAGCAVLNNQVWLWGGRYNMWYGPGQWQAQYMNDVWWSIDAAHWSSSTHTAPWSGREGFAGIVFSGRLFVIGGRSEAGFMCDVWATDDPAPSTPVHYVDASSSEPKFPYADLGDAATSIQEALDASSSGDTVAVQDGTYRLDLPLYVTKAVSVVSANGAAATIIDGNAATRCLNVLNPGAVVDGFTISNGFSQNGGGAHLEGGTLRRCIVVANTAWGTKAGGVACYNATIESSVIMGNASSNIGGGVYCTNGFVRNCTIVGNRAVNGGGGIYTTDGGSVQNCIVYYNSNVSAIATANWKDDNSNAYQYCCTTPLPSSAGNITNAPLLVNYEAGNCREMSYSPCINAGSNMPWMADAKDMDGTPRLCNNRVDIGAYEFRILRTLEVASESPSSNVYVRNVPSDIHGIAAGTTPFSLVYEIDTVVTLTATSAVADAQFDRWKVREIDHSVNPQLVLSISQDVAATAVYVPSNAASDISLYLGSLQVTNNGIVACGITSNLLPIQATFIITNAGGTTAGLTGNPPVAISSATPGCFAISNQPAAFVLPGHTSSFMLVFTPPAAGTNGNGTARATLSIPYTKSPQSPLQADVSCSWRNTQPAVSPQVSASDGTSTNSVALSWAAVEGATHYYLQSMPLTNGGVYGPLVSHLAATKYLDVTVIPGVLYTYRVQAWNEYGFCATWGSSDTGFAMLMPPGNLEASDGAFPSKIRLMWSPVVGADKYCIYRAPDPSKGARGAYTPLAVVASTNYDDFAIEPGAYYYYAVSATGQACESASSIPSSGYAAIAAPLNVNASDGLYTGLVHVAWNTVAGAQHYHVYRGTNSSLASVTTVSDCAANWFWDNAVQTGQLYYYWVESHGKDFTSGKSVPDVGYPLFLKINVTDPPPINWTRRNINAVTVRLSGRMIQPSWLPLFSNRWQLVIAAVVSNVIDGPVTSTAYRITFGPYSIAPLTNRNGSLNWKIMVLHKQPRKPLNGEHEQIIYTSMKNGGWLRVDDDLESDNDAQYIPRRCIVCLVPPGATRKGIEQVGLMNMTMVGFDLQPREPVVIDGIQHLMPIPIDNQDSASSLPPPAP